MVERITGPTPPVSLRNVTGRIPDGREVPQPPRPTQPPVTRRQLVAGWLAALIVLALLVAGIAS